jgi:hypothetical protein
MTLLALLEEAAAGLSDIEVRTAPTGEVTWSRGGRPFAVVSGDGAAAEFALDPAVAAAASRTPDVVPSGLGAEWVLFRPAVLDDHGRDRARAWFESAYRRLSTG